MSESTILGESDGKNEKARYGLTGMSDGKRTGGGFSLIASEASDGSEELALPVAGGTCVALFINVLQANYPPGSSRSKRLDGLGRKEVHSRTTSSPRLSGASRLLTGSPESQ